MKLMHFKSLFRTSSNAVIEHQRLTSLVNSMADAVLAVDENIKVVLYNAAALGLLDLNNMAQNAPLAEVFKPVDKDGQPVDIEKMIRDTSVPIITRDLRLRYGDSSVVNLYMSVAPVHQGYGTQGKAGYVLMLRDITHEKSLEEEREEFISVVSHELRTPIAVTEGNISNAQLIAKKGGDPAQLHVALGEAHSQVVFLADMINDLATLSRAERNKLDLEVTEINIPKLLDNLLANYSPGAQAKGLALLAQASPDIPPLSSSELYLKEILQNFITNAIKYTDEGSVTIKATPYEGGIEFTVTDTGIGISKSDQEKVFDKFFRSEDFRTRKANGTGLGLYITMKLVKHIKANIRLESEPNKGSTFIVDVPNLEPTQAPAEAKEQSLQPADGQPTETAPAETNPTAGPSAAPVATEPHA
jgi:PAS domain S-box-containing protein